jgi:hypothetical protein
MDSRVTVRSGDQVRQIAPYGMCASYLPYDHLFVTRVVDSQLVELSTKPGGQPLTDDSGKVRTFPARCFATVPQGAMVAA